MGLGQFFDVPTFGIATLNTVFREHLIAQHHHGGVVSDQSVFQAQVYDALLQVLFFAEIIDLPLHALNGGVGPQAIQLRVIAAGGGEVETGFVLLVLATHVGTQGDFRRAVTPVVAEQHDLTAMVDATDTLRLQVGGAHAVDIDLHVVHGLVGELGGGVENLPGDVIAVGDADSKAVAGIGHGGEHGPIAAVAHDKGE